MVYISEEHVSKLLDMKNCIHLMEYALKALYQKDASQVLRISMGISNGNVLGVMPAAINSANIAGSKVITVFPGNFNKGLPSHQGVVLLFETETGSIKAAVDGNAITGIRTAAVSAAATKVLARKDASVLALLGSGLQARKHVEAITSIRDIKEVAVWDISVPSMKKFKEDIEGLHNIPVNVCDTPEKAVACADIICTVTASKVPVLAGAKLKPGAHINAVGACSADARELDSEAVKRGRFFCDSIESVLAESGDFLIALEEKAVAREHLLGELGGVLSGDIPGRLNETDITIFESLGLATEDLIAADHVYTQYIK